MSYDKNGLGIAKMNAHKQIMQQMKENDKRNLEWIKSVNVKGHGVPYPMFSRSSQNSFDRLIASGKISFSKKKLYGYVAKEVTP
jgi:hypothetical protein